MPIEASRILDRVEEVRLIRIQELTEEDAEGLGMIKDFEWHKEAFKKPVMLYRSFVKEIDAHETAIGAYRSLHESQFPGSWEKNEWYWYVKTVSLSTVGRPEGV